MGKRNQGNMTLSEIGTGTGCRSTLGHEGKDLKLTLDCLACGGRGPFLDTACMKHALEALSRESGADTLTASGHVEVQLRSGGLAVLERIVSLGNDLDNLSKREPKGRDCSRCRSNPGALFATLRDSLLADPAAFGDSLRAAMTNARPSGANCDACLSETEYDIGFAADSFGELVRHIVRQGFQIIV